MTAETKQHISGWLNEFPEVRWDRLVETPEEVFVYGWIAREDGRADFLLLDFWNTSEGTPGFQTSSAEMSAEISRRLGIPDESHSECQRVEDVFGGLVANKIALSGRAVR